MSSRPRNHAELLHHPEVVHQDAAVNHLSAHNAVDHHALHADMPASGRNAKKRPLVRSGPREAAHYLLALFDVSSFTQWMSGNADRIIAMTSLRPSRPCR